VIPEFRNGSVAGHLRALAEALPPGSAVTVPCEWLLEVVSNGSAPNADEVPEKMLTAPQVAEMLNIGGEESKTPERWVYAHAEKLGGKRLSRRCLRFPESAVKRYLARTTIKSRAEVSADQR
jgi:hypothetical protein